MIWIMGHPGFDRLSRFADGELEDRERTRVAEHVSRCPRCRDEIAFIRRTGDVARSIPTPQLSDEVLHRIIARRAAGERVLLPMADAGAPRRRRPPVSVPGAIAAMLALMIAGLFVSVRILEADKPTFRALPEQPAAGEVLRVEYRGGQLFADQSHLKLRGRYRTADDREWQLLAGILTRGDDGLYRTEVALPDSVVYAAFAVESLDGQRLDSNNRQLWDVMVHEDGLPTIDALGARIEDLTPRDWGEAYEEARRMTTLYPDMPQSWATRYSFETALSSADSLLTEYVSVYSRLERRFASEAAHHREQIPWLAILALAINDVESAGHWIRSARAANARTPVLAQAEVMEAALRNMNRPDSLLAELDEVWGQWGNRAQSAASYGLAVSARSGRVDLALRWALRLDAEEATRNARDLLPLATDVSPEITRRWAEVDRTNRANLREGGRRLRLTPLEYERRQLTESQGLLALLAQMALASGRVDEARSLALEAVDLSWNSVALMEIGRILVETGSMAAGLKAFARAAADPAAPPVPASIASHADWDRLLRASSADLRRYVLAGSVIRFPDPDMVLVGQDGTTRAADWVGHLTVVSFMAGQCRPSLEILRAVSAFRESSEDVEVVVIESGSGDLGMRVGRGELQLPIYSDPHGAARAAFRSSGTPQHFVLDSRGRIRFEYSSWDEIPRQIAALRQAESAAAVAD